MIRARARPGLPVRSTGSSSSTPFTPASLSPALWLDSSDAATILSSGGFVSQWSDKSANGYNVTQAVGSKQPSITSTTLNGKPVLSFDGVDDTLGSLPVPMASFFNATGTTLYMVDRFNSGVLQLSINDSASNRISFEGGNRLDLPNDSSSRINTGSTSGVWTIRTARRSTTSLRLFYGASLQGTATNGDTLVAASIPIYIASLLGAFGFANDDMAELIIYGRYLSDSENTSVLTYLQSKWGL